jgi:hypothetical protein
MSLPATVDGAGGNVVQEFLVCNLKFWAAAEQS